MGEQNRGRRIVRSRNAMRLRSDQPRNCPSLTPRRRSRTETGSQARTASGITIQSSTPRRHRSASAATIEARLGLDSAPVSVTFGIYVAEHLAVQRLDVRVRRLRA